MKHYLSKPNIAYTDVVVCGLLIILFFAFLVLGLHISDGFMKKSQIVMGYMTVPLPEGGESLLFIDNGKSEVLGIRNGKVEFQLRVGSGSDTFYQAENLFVDPRDGSFYLHSVDWNTNGFSLDSERILHYDRWGRYLGTVYKKSYTLEEDVSQHRVYDPRVIDGRLYLVYADEKGVCQFCVEEGEAVTVASYSYEDAWIFFQNFSQAGEKDFYGVEKTGHLLHFLGEEVETAYTFQKDEKEVLYFVETDQEGGLYYTDIYNGRICKVTGSGEHQVITRAQDFFPVGEFKPGQDQMISLKVTQAGEEKRLGFALSHRAIICDGEGELQYCTSEFEKDFSFLLRCFLVWGILGLAVLLFVYLLLRFVFYLRVNRPKISIFWRVELSFALFATVITVLILYQSNRNFENIYITSQSNHLEELALMGAHIIEEEWLENIQDMDDFMGEDYRKVSKALNLVAVNCGDVSRRYGGAVVILKEDGRCFFIAYPDNSISVYYPTDEYTKWEMGEIYRDKTTKKDRSLLSSGGTFIATTVPILGSEGQVIGGLTVTLDNYKEEAKLSSAMRSIFINVILVVALIMFLMKEVFGKAEE